MFNNENMENGAFYQLISEFGGWMIFVGTWKLKTDLNPQGSNHGGHSQVFVSTNIGF